MTEIGALLAKSGLPPVDTLRTRGTGKTRLAREVTAAHTTVFADGVAFVQLASVQASNQIAAGSAQP